MSESRHPQDLREALSVTPLLHLIPKQDIAPLISTNFIVANPDDSFLNNQYQNGPIQKFRDSINQNPTQYQQIINDIVEEFSGYDDEELNDIKFRNPLNGVSESEAPPDSSWLNSDCIEQQIFLAAKDIEQGQIFHSERVQPYELGSRLSVRKNYEENKEKAHLHNERYLRKYRKELESLGIYANATNQSKESAEIVSNKRALDASIRDQPEAKRIQKQSYLNGEEMVAKSFNTLVATIEELIESEQDTAEHNNSTHVSLWTSKRETVVPSFQALTRVIDNLFRVVNNPIFQRIDIGLLGKFQGICLRTINEGLQWNWNEIRNFEAEPEKMHIQNLFDSFFHFNLAAKITVMILNSGIKDKRIYLDEYLKVVVDFSSLVFEDMIKPFASVSSSSSSMVESSKSMFGMLISEIGTTINLITSHVHSNTIDENILTRLEYLSIMIIFTDGQKKDKNLILETSSVEELKSSSYALIVEIFKSVKDQRNFILNEILINVDKLSTQKSIARQFKLGRGGNVQLVSALLVNLVESAKIKGPLPVSTSAEPSSDRKVLLQRFEPLARETRELLSESTQTANDVASYLVDKISKSPDQATKHSLELFLQDLMIMLPYPEWPGCEILLIAIIKSFLLTLQSQNCGALLETYLLEMLGLIGEKVLALKKTTEYFKISDSSSDQDLCHINGLILNTIEYLQVQGYRNQSYISSMHFIVLKYLALLEPVLYSNLESETVSSAESATNLTTDMSQIANNTSCLDTSPSETIFSAYNNLIAVLAGDYSKPQNSTALDQNSIDAYKSLLLSNELSDLYDNFLNLLLKSIESPKIKTKTRALKILSTLIEREPLLLVSPYVQESISNRLTDGSPLVRDAVIDLVSKYLSSKPEVIERFYRPICDCMNDESVQVRKRVIRLAREMYLNTSSKEVKSNIASRLLKRLDDEDDVMQTLARDYLREIWFLSKLNDNNAISESVDVMVDLVSNSKYLKYFSRFISNYVIAEPKIRLALLAVVGKAVDLITDVPEMSPNRSIEDTMKLVSTLVKCDGTLLQQDSLILLQPHLIGEQKPGSSICFYSLEILRYSLSGIDSLRPDYLNFVQSYILKQLTKFNIRELHVAMPCVWRLCEMKGETIKLANATVSCLKLIKPFIDEQKSKNENKKGVKPMEQDKVSSQRLQKLIHLLGCFGKYCSFESHRESFLKSSLGLKDKESVVSVMIKFLLYFADVNVEISIRNASITNIINICSAHPKLFLSDAILKVLDREFASQDSKIIHSILQGLMEFLSNEDNDSRKQNASGQNSSKNTKLDVAVFHGNAKSYLNDGICAGIVQRYISVVLKLCLQDSGKFSFIPIQFLQLVIKLGFANPKLCIPTIIALESSPSLPIKNIGLELHRELFEKHESLTSTSWGEGLKLAVEYRIRTSENFMGESGFINNLYSIVQNNYSSKKKFVQSLSKVLQVNLDEKSKSKAEFQKNMVAFISKNVSSEKLGSLEEVFILVSCLDKEISAKGADLKESLNIIVEENSEIASRELLLVFAQTITILVHLRQCLIFQYGVHQPQIEAFRPGKVEIELRSPLKYFNHADFMIESHLITTEVLKHSEQICLSFTSSVEEFI